MSCCFWSHGVLPQADADGCVKRGDVKRRLASLAGGRARRAMPVELTDTGGQFCKKKVDYDARRRGSVIRTLSERPASTPVCVGH